MFRKIIRDRLLGRARFQRFFEQLNSIALAGMNYGTGHDVHSSGESEVLKYLLRHIKNGSVPIVFDVGANIGEYSQQVLSRLGTDVQLYCFEPSKQAYAMLAEKLVGRENAALFNFGFGDKQQTATLYADAVGSALGSVFNRRLQHFDIDMSCTEEIQLRRLDDFCDEKGIRHIDLLKLDVEGNELSVLKGAENLIDAGAIDLIQFEFGGCNIDSRTYFQDFFYLLNARYRIHRIVRDGLIPIDKYKETCEVFVTTNYVAISRARN